MRCTLINTIADGTLIFLQPPLQWRVCLTLDISLMQDGVTALYMASHNGHNDVVQLLLDSGAQTEIPATVCTLYSYCVYIYIICS